MKVAAITPEISPAKIVSQNDHNVGWYGILLGVGCAHGGEQNGK